MKEDLWRSFASQTPQGEVLFLKPRTMQPSGVPNWFCRR
jgi:hypothetical protein